MAAFTFSEPQRLFDERSGKFSFFRRLLDRLVEARMVEARLHVNAHLMMLDDATLAQYGVDRVMVRSSNHRPVAY